MMPEQIREFDLHNGAARDHVFYSIGFKQDVYKVGDVARAVCAIPIVFKADVACARVTAFRPNALRRYPSRSHLMSQLSRTFSRDTPLGTRQHFTPERCSSATRQFHTPPRTTQNRIRRNQDIGNACTQPQLSSVFTLNLFRPSCKDAPGSA